MAPPPTPLVGFLEAPPVNMDEGEVIDALGVMDADCMGIDMDGIEPDGIIDMDMLLMPIPIPMSSFFLALTYETYQVSNHLLPVGTIKGHCNTHLDNSRPRNNVIIGSLSVPTSQDNITLPGNTLWDSNHKLTITFVPNRRPDGTSSGDESSMHIRCIHILEALTSHQLDHGPGHGRHHAITGAHSEGRKWLDGQLHIARRTGSDEGRGNSVDLVEIKGVVEGLGEGDLALGCAEIGAVTGFNSEDAAGCGEVGAVHDFGSSTKVSTDTDACIVG